MIYLNFRLPEKTADNLHTEILISLIANITYQEYKESKLLEIGSGVDMDELAAILDMGEF